MKPSANIIGALAKIGLGILVTELATDMGKAFMFSAVKKVNPKTANELMRVMDISIDSDEVKSLKKCKLKIVKGMCEAVTKN